MNLCLHAQTIISLGDTQFRVPVLQGFFGQILPEAKRRRGDFSENPKGTDLAGLWGHGITFAQ